MTLFFDNIISQKKEEKQMKDDIETTEEIIRDRFYEAEKNAQAGFAIALALLHVAEAINNSKPPKKNKVKFE